MDARTDRRTGPLLGVGTVRHHRLRPKPHAFAYPVFFYLLPLRRLRDHPEPALARGRPAWAGFDDRDHGDGRSDCLAWFDELLAHEGIADADGEVWLQCLPRLLGHAFKPVSFWYAHRADGSLAAIVVEVNNTFGDRHCYLLAGPELAWGRELRAPKAMHVSPFCSADGLYRFRFMRTFGPQPRCVVRIEYDDERGPALQTSMGGHLQPLCAASLRRALWRMPLLALGVVARIHWQALQLWWRGTPVFARQMKPPRPVGHSPVSITRMS